MTKVDIIVPIYNAYEYTEECIKSVLKHTDLKKNNLILINDKSPDEKILPMLKKYADENPDKNIIVLDNEENLGFVKTVNKGMSYSENDVLLLNSDTEVTKNWLEKIVECAYSNEYISTVTPLTNNGTIASVPNFGVDNELPKNMSLDEYAEMIEKCSLKRFPELTTANGFCMFIKRVAINEVGLFDDVTFGKGYGEENDFCYRALNRGYTHVLCDNTFVYHKGTQSFKAENMTSDKLALVQEHMKKLTDKHPTYVWKTDNFIGINPTRDIQENVKINIDVYGKKRILFIVNEWEENMEMSAGTSLNLKDIILGIKNEIACFVMCPDKNDLSRFNLYLYSEDTARMIFTFKTETNLYGNIIYHDQSYSEFVEKLFQIFNFDIVHVHHLIFQPFDIADIAKKYDAYSVISLHDLYMLCPSINMIFEDTYCENIDPEKCRKCFKKRQFVDEDILENWRENCYKALRKFNKIIVPSENTKQLFNDVYEDLKIDVIEHGTHIYKVEEKNIESTENFDIAFVGVMAKHKGKNVLKQLVNQNKNTNLKIHLFGKTDDEDLQKDSENYKFHGEYKREELPQLLIDNNIKLVCIFSICPETYSYTLTETYMAKVPVLAYNIGAIGDRIEKDKLGWIIDKKSEISDVLAKITEIMEKKQEYQAIKNNFKNHKLKTISQMQEEYLSIYSEIQTIKNKFVNLTKIQELTKNIQWLQVRLHDAETENLRKEDYIRYLEQFKEENDRKAEYINALENERAILSQRLARYENLKIVKLIRKLRGRK